MQGYVGAINFVDDSSDFPDYLDAFRGDKLISRGVILSLCCAQAHSGILF